MVSVTVLQFDIQAPKLNPSQLPSGWTICVHPQGWVYFHHASLGLVTDHDIREEEVLQTVEDQISLSQSAYLSHGFEVHLQIQRHTSRSGREIAAPPIFNLVINHKSCVASYDLNDIIEDAVPETDLNTLNRQRRLYWNYLWNHPSHIDSCPSRAIPDALDALTWYLTENMISGSNSVTPFSKQECQELSRIVKDLSSHSTPRSVCKIVFLAWFLREVCSFRDAENWGLHTKKQARDLHAQRQRPMIVTNRPTHEYLPLVNLLIRLVFFGIPWTYLAHIKTSFEYTGRLSDMQLNWEQFIGRLVREYSHFLLISTVLLSATVGFLAVPEQNSVATFATTLSSFASLCSIIIGVFSIWRHQANTSTTDSFTYMRNAQYRFLGFHGHAILLSLPAVFLVWAIVTFMIAILAYTIQGFNDPEPFRRVTVWVTLGMILVAIGAVVAALHTFAIIWSFQSRETTSLRQRIASFLSPAHRKPPSRLPV